MVRSKRTLTVLQKKTPHIKARKTAAAFPYLVQCSDVRFVERSGIQSWTEPAKGLKAFFSLLLWSKTDALRTPVRAWVSTLSQSAPTITTLATFVHKSSKAKTPDHFRLYGGESTSTTAVFDIPLQPLRNDTPCLLDHEVTSFLQATPPGPWVVIVISKTSMQKVRRDLSIYSLPRQFVVMRTTKKTSRVSPAVDVDATLAHVDLLKLTHVCDMTIPLFSSSNAV